MRTQNAPLLRERIECILRWGWNAGVKLAGRYEQREIVPKVVLGQNPVQQKSSTALDETQKVPFLSIDWSFLVICM